MFVVRFSFVVLLLSVVFVMSCGQTTEEIELAVAGMD